MSISKCTSSTVEPTTQNSQVIVQEMQTFISSLTSYCSFISEFNSNIQKILENYDSDPSRRYKLLSICPSEADTSSLTKSIVALASTLSIEIGNTENPVDVHVETSEIFPNTASTVIPLEDEIFRLVGSFTKKFREFDSIICDINSTIQSILDPDKTDERKIAILNASPNKELLLSLTESISNLARMLKIERDSTKDRASIHETAYQEAPVD